MSNFRYRKRSFMFGSVLLAGAFDRVLRLMAITADVDAPGGPDQVAGPT